MIVDTLNHLSRYRGIHSALDSAIDWLETHTLEELPNGRTIIDGDRVFINIMEADLRPSQLGDFEYHHRYADLQINLTGSEYWEWAMGGEPTVPFDGTKDVGFMSASKQASGMLGEGRFALFLPNELHKPSCIYGDCTHVRKAVIKIEMA